jgi:general secretion pathway protein E
MKDTMIHVREKLLAALRLRVGDAEGSGESAHSFGGQAWPTLPWLKAQYDAGELKESDLHAVLAEALGLKVRAAVDPKETDPQFVQNIPIHFARRHRVLALKPVDGIMPVVTHFPTDPGVIDHVGAILRTATVVELAPAAVIERAIHQAYAAQESDVDSILEDAAMGTSAPADNIVFGDEGDLLDSATRAPVVKLVNTVLFEAVKRLASDVHVQPLAGHVQVRFRIDGVLYDYLQIPSHTLDEVISRIKVVGRMDIAEKRLAQDGRTTVTVGERSIDLRISIIPTCYGERAVIRLLDKSARLYELSELGMSDADRERFEELIQRTHGIILVTGPTGSGKSTTLYAALQRLNATEKNIITLEDPIEYQLPGISQVQVSTKKGMTFATGLRSVLRQDPDIIMVGEIRDQETARMAVQSSLTGHLVFSTLHTNNAAGAVSRLLDLGIEPYLVASSLLASLAQRLVRRVCRECCERIALTADDCRLLDLGRGGLGQRVPRATGCDACAMTGYRGRQGIFELLHVDEAIRELIVRRAKTGEIERSGMNAGMRTLRQDAVRKLLEGETTVEEISRVTHQEHTDNEEISDVSAAPVGDDIQTSRSAAEYATRIGG